VALLPLDVQGLLLAEVEIAVIAGIGSGVLLEREASLPLVEVVALKGIQAEEVEMIDDPHRGKTTLVPVNQNHVLVAVRCLAGVDVIIVAAVVEVQVWRKRLHISYPMD